MFSKNIQSHAAPHAVAIDDTTLGSLRYVMRERFNSIIVKYFETGAFYISQIETGVLRNNATLVMENAHPLKSASAALGASRVAALAAQIERHAAKSPDVTRLAPLLRQLKKAFHEASGELHDRLSF